MIYQDFITQTLQEATQIANQYFGTVTGTIKGGDNNEVVTKADLEIGAFIVDKIKTAYPDHNIIDEESGVINRNSQLTWVVDPIDGTSNFASGIPLYGVMIGLLSDSIPVAGGISLPFFNEIYYAEKGEGAFCNGGNIMATQEAELLHVLVAYGMDSHQEHPSLTHDECNVLANIVLNIRNLRMSNSCFDIMMVAQGKYGAWLSRSTKIWDNVAPHIILEEAGAIVTDIEGNQMDYSNALSKTKDNFTICAAPTEIHKKLMAILKA